MKDTAKTFDLQILDMEGRSARHHSFITPEKEDIDIVKGPYGHRYRLSDKGAKKYGIAVVEAHLVPLTTEDVKKMIKEREKQIEELKKGLETES